MTCSVVGGDECIPLEKMRCGELAVVVDWPAGKGEVGKVVQRYNESLVIVGCRSGECYSRMFVSGYDPSGCRVRVLQPGATIQLDES